MEEIEAHRRSNESRAFYQKVNKGRAPFRPRLQSCKNKDNTLLINKDDILDRWARPFKALLKEESPITIEGGVKNACGTRNEDGDVGPPDFEEFEDALRRMKNNKAPGRDGLPAELYKYGGEDLHKVMYDLVLTIWQDERMPRQWSNAIICPIHKKGDLLECTNYRGVSLLLCSYKLLSNILFNRLSQYAKREVPGRLSTR